MNQPCFIADVLYEDNKLHYLWAAGPHSESWSLNHLPLNFKSFCSTWSEIKLFLSPQYARVHETQTHSETELQDAVKVLRDFLETSTAKLTSPVQVSLSDVKTFVRNVQVEMKPPECKTV